MDEYISTIHVILYISECCCCCFIMGSSENGLVTMLRTYPVSGNSEGFKTFCNGCKKRMAARNMEGSHGVQSDKNVNKADLQSYIYQTSNREAYLGAIVFI